MRRTKRTRTFRCQRNGEPDQQSSLLPRSIAPAPRSVRVLHQLSPSLENRGRGEDRVPASTHGPPRREVARKARRPQVRAESHRPSPRSGLRLIRALLGEPAFATVTRVMRKHHRELGACMGAPGPHDFAVRKSATRQSAPSRPPHPASRAVTIAMRPSCLRRDRHENASDLPKLQGWPPAADWLDGQFEDGWYAGQGPNLSPSP